MTQPRAGRQLEGRELLERQRAVQATALPGPRVLAVGVRLAGNLGQLLRAADAAGVSEVLLAGAADFDPRVVRKVSRNCDESVPWRVLPVEDALAAAPRPLVAVELTSSSVSVVDAPLRGPCTLVVGGERDGIPAAVLERCDFAMHVPMYGRNGSMNVTHALAIALHEWRRHNPAAAG